MSGRVYATIGDLEARWRPLSSEEESTAEILLEDASALLRSICRGLDEALDRGDVEESTVKSIVCSMVRRSMNIPDSVFGVSNMQESVGPFSHSRTFAGPTGDLYVTRLERERLGCGVKAYTVSTIPNPERVRW